MDAVVPEADVDVPTQRALGPLQPKSERVQIRQAGGHHHLFLWRLRLDDFHHFLLNRRFLLCGLFFRLRSPSLFLEPLGLFLSDLLYSPLFLTCNLKVGKHIFCNEFKSR